MDNRNLFNEQLDGNINMIETNKYNSQTTLCKMHRQKLIQNFNYIFILLGLKKLFEAENKL